MTIELTITITEQPSGTENDDAYFGTVLINGTEHHITLVEVQQDMNETQEGLTTWGDNCLAAMHQFESTDDDFHTITVGDRQFVVVITPYLR